MNTNKSESMEQNGVAVRSSGIVVPRSLHALYRTWRDVSALADQCREYGHESLSRKLDEAASDAIEAYEEATRHNAKLTCGPNL